MPGWLSRRHATFDLGAMSLSLMWVVEPTLKKGGGAARTTKELIKIMYYLMEKHKD